MGYWPIPTVPCVCLFLRRTTVLGSASLPSLTERVLHVHYQAVKQTCSTLANTFAIQDHSSGCQTSSSRPNWHICFCNLTYTFLPTAFSPLPYNTKKHWSLQDSLPPQFFGVLFWSVLFYSCKPVLLSLKVTFFLALKKCLRKKYWISPLVPVWVSVFQHIWGNVSPWFR